MTSELRRAWDAFWFRPASALGVVGTRTLVATSALWIVLSRPDLPSLRQWPSPFWDGVEGAWAWRYLIFDATRSIEGPAYALLCATLGTTALGILPRASSFVAGLLLYHFAPFEEILTTGLGPHSRGLTVPIVALVALSAVAPVRLGSPESWEWRWPVRLVQALFAFSHLFAAVARLRAAGPGWYSAAGIEGLALLLISTGAHAPWGRWLIGNALLSGTVGAVWLATGLTLWTAVFSRRAALRIVPVAIALDLFTLMAFGAVNLGLPLALVFLDWDALCGKLVRGAPRQERLE